MVGLDLGVGTRGDHPSWCRKVEVSGVRVCPAEIRRPWRGVFGDEGVLFGSEQGLSGRDMGNKCRETTENSGHWGSRLRVV